MCKDLALAVFGILISILRWGLFYECSFSVDDAGDPCEHSFNVTDASVR